MSKKFVILFSDGKRGYEGDFPIATVREIQSDSLTVVDPIFDYRIKDNLYGRMMTLLEATCDPQKLKAVKDVFSKEINEWSNEVYRSAREIAEGGGSSHNLYN